MRATSLGHAGILIETTGGSIVCDPWFVPAFFGSWFVFPRNDQLSAELMDRIEHPDYLYISHLHADHLDETWLAEHISRDTTVLLPGYPTRELERRMRALGFTTFIRTTDGIEHDLGGGLRVAVHVETSITDGPGGDSAIVVSDPTGRVLNQNDCRPADLGALGSHGRVDLQFLQHSGAIWYPMVYDDAADQLAELCQAKVDSQVTRAMRYVEAVDARAVVPSAGPPCFIDPELFHLNVITGDEPSIFPDQTAFLATLQAAGRGNGILNIPGTAITVEDGKISVEHPLPGAEVERIFSDKAAYLAEYQADWSNWLTEHKRSWHPARPDLLERLQHWWHPLLAMAPSVRQGVGANVLIRTGEIDIIVDFPNGEVRAHEGEDYRYRFDIPRELIETVVDRHEVDWSNALFLSCRFRAWREGPFNEYVYNFLKSLSVERMRRTESEALHRLSPLVDGEFHEIPCGEFMIERFCPHRQADLSVFGELEGTVLTCTLHGWKFDLETGACLTATDHSLRVRPRDRSVN
jgi:UDP-MurNAc hydroxylase